MAGNDRGQGGLARLTEEEVEVYEPEELDALWAVTTPEEKLVWEFFLGTGISEAGGHLLYRAGHQLQAEDRPGEA